MTRQQKNIGDDFWMKRALALARRGEGLTRPNPPVGAVAVRDGRIVGEGYHREAGGPHAEVIALKRAGRRARGCTLYVTLEPCCSWGRTPPCTDLIIASGVRKVVVAARDPNPRHAGRGLAILRRRGIRVAEGVGAEEGAELVAPFAKWIRQGLPYVTLKLGMSLDGKIGDAEGHSRWITGPDAREKVHELRRRVDGILVGAGTIRGDDPMLLPRPDRGRKPWRIVAAGRGGIPWNAKVLRDPRKDQTIVAVSRDCPSATVKRLKATGVNVEVLPANRGRLSLTALLRRLGKRGLLHVLCEGGSELAASLVEAGLVDEFCFYVSPCIIGGTRSKPAIGGSGWALGRNPKLRIVSVERAGQDVMIRARPY